ncbi:hypothetical protein YB2330_002035 [Saitoella coloradoensis]
MMSEAGETDTLLNSENDVYSDPIPVRRPSSLLRSLLDRDSPTHQRTFVRPHYSRRWLYALLPTLLRALQFAAILAVLIAFFIQLRYSPKPPSEKASSAKFDFKVNLSSLHVEQWDPEFKWTHKAELHAHTTVSDGQMSPEQLVEWAVAYDFDILLVTDHNTIESGLAAKRYAEKHYPKELLVIPGVEYTCCRIHMNLIGINETIKPPAPFPTDQDLYSAINWAHELGGLVIVNHRAWSADIEDHYDQPRLPTHPSLKQLVEWGIDGIESAHEGTVDLRSLRLAQKNDWGLLAANDIHGPSSPPRGYTLLNLPSSSRPTQASVIQALRSSTSASFLIIPEGASPRAWTHSNPAFDKYAPLTSVNFDWLYKERKGMYSFVDGFCHERRFEMKWWRIWWFLVWVILGFLVYEVVRALVGAAILACLGAWISKRSQRRGGDVERVAMD